MNYNINKNYYLGIDIGSISTKAVIIDDENNIIIKSYLWTEGNPIKATKKILEKIRNYNKNINVVGVGTTGSAREIIGVMLGANIIKNEITAHAIGTLNFYPDARTIIEIGGQDSKIIIIKNGIVVDYAMNTLCAAGTGSFLSSQAKRLNIEIEKFGEYAIKSKNVAKIAGRCAVFAESDLIHKAQMGYNKEDLIAGLCDSIVNNYLNNLGKGKDLSSPIIFQGGVSKNIGVIKYFEKNLGKKIIVDELGHLMGAIGIAILSKNNIFKKPFNFNIKNDDFITKIIDCKKCPNNCEIIYILKNKTFLDCWGNRCSCGIDKNLMR